MTLPPSTQHPLRWAVLGTGFIANKVINVGMRRAGHVLQAVGSRSIDKAQEFADRNGFKTAYGSYQEAIDDPEVDAVYIALPSVFVSVACGLHWEIPLTTDQHEEWAIKCAKAKKHVLCEKPVAPTTAQVKNIIQTCKDNNVVFLDGTFFKHHPRLAALRQLVNSGELGKVNSVNSHFSFLMSADVSTSADAALKQIRVNPAVEPTGVLGDMAWYTVRFILTAYNYELPTSVSCTVTRKNEFTGAAEQVIGHLLFPDSRNAIFEASFAHVSNQRSCITGDKGAVALDDTFLTSSFYPITQESALAYEAPASDSFSVTVKRGEWTKREIETGGRLQEEWMAKDFEECVAGRKKWEQWADETIVIHTVLDALWASAQQSGASVSL
ncbi:hypothetical protein HDU99_000312 [Rhizoclosmatium hyalinum]|nr:hypothetical protein HDU99_000312 [Rhizoclosmatium hyalinum]